MEHPVRCPLCGFLQEDANFCRQCGSSLRFAAREVPPSSEPVTFPWSLFAGFLLAAFVLAGMLGLAGVRPEAVQPALAGVVLASVVWVAFDARRKQVPRPWIWILAVWLFWLVALPWYLERRRHPERPCLVDSPRNRREAALFLVSVVILTFFLLALARFLTRQTTP